MLGLLPDAFVLPLASKLTPPVLLHTHTSTELPPGRHGVRERLHRDQPRERPAAGKCSTSDAPALRLQAPLLAFTFRHARSNPHQHAGASERQLHPGHHRDDDARILSWSRQEPHGECTGARGLG